MDLYAYDASLRGEESNLIAGVDEAGRGPLAGPVVAAAVILKAGCRIEGVRDSKTVPPREREFLFQEIMASSLDWGVGLVEAEEIDRINILQATKLAMLSAVRSLAVTPDLVITDAVTLPALKVKQIPIIKGDAKSASVAAASIIAKELRDRIMGIYHALFPLYGFGRHKGYGTRAHLATIRKYGPCPIHRKSFRGVSVLPLPFAEETTGGGHG